MSVLRFGLLFGLAFLAGCASTARSGERTAPSTFGPSDEAIDGRVWLEETAKLGERAGAGPLQILAVGPGTPGDHVPGLVDGVSGEVDDGVERARRRSRFDDGGGLVVTQLDR